MSPEDRISRSGAVMYCGVPVFAYKIIWASILPQTDLCHSEDSFTSPSLSLHWSLLNFSPTAPFPWRCYFFPKCPTFALAVRDGESDGAVVINKSARATPACFIPSFLLLLLLWSGATSRVPGRTPPPLFFFSRAFPIKQLDETPGSEPTVRGSVPFEPFAKSFCAGVKRKPCLPHTTPPPHHNQKKQTKKNK